LLSAALMRLDCEPQHGQRIVSGDDQSRYMTAFNAAAAAKFRHPVALPP
jgi:hypothetical protein